MSLLLILIGWAVAALIFIGGVMFGRMVGWHQGYDAGAKQGELIPEEGSPFVKITH